ncbi:MAG: short-chain dehydrogenase/reductase [Ramlibacter sp.]|nr:short-chain dehydrogenase/reductase [Ramlibacter sp.]
MLKDKVAIVTGAGSGIGRAIALAYARAGAKVVVSDTNPVSGEETVALVRQAGGSALFAAADVSVAPDCARLVERTVQAYGRLDIACNNAGIGGEQAPTADYPLDAWQRVIGVNLTGVFHCMKYEIAQMLKGGGGAIVNIASILGAVGFANAPAYTAAKHGVLGLTKTAALEYGPQRVRINAVGPAFIHTPMIAGLEQDPASLAQLVGLHPIGRLGTSEEVAEMVLWLSGPGASFVTGGYYPVDGGYLAR